MVKGCPQTTGLGFGAGTLSPEFGCSDPPGRFRALGPFASAVCEVHGADGCQRSDFRKRNEARLSWVSGGAIPNEHVELQKNTADACINATYVPFFWCFSS